MLKIPSPSQIPSSFNKVFYSDIISGLSKDKKSLPCKWFYDAHGSQLYDQITTLEEYYPTRTERSILKNSSIDIAKIIGDKATVIEYGPGATDKTGILLAALENVQAYIPIDVSIKFLESIEKSIKNAFPKIKVYPVQADFTEKVALPTKCQSGNYLGFFSGSTIGNFSDLEISSFLKNTRQTQGQQSRLIIGYDLIKDPEILTRAYDDHRGVTAAFNKNLLTRINRELDANFNLEAFRHEARWNANKSQIEMHLISLEHQTVDIAGISFVFEVGETIHTENSRKFTTEQVRHLFAENGWEVDATFTDDKDYFAVSVLSCQPS